MANKFSSQSEIGPVGDVSNFGSARSVPRAQDVDTTLVTGFNPALSTDGTDDARAARTGASDLKIPEPDLVSPSPGTQFFGEGGDLTKQAGYEDASSVNTVARDGGSPPELNTTGAIDGQDLSCGSERRARYGRVQVTETASGHQIILNDTLGSESIMIRHASGSGIELRPDGSLLISATEIVYNVQGKSNFVVQGSTTFKTDGDITFEAGGSVNMSATGGISMDTSGDFNQKVGGKSTSIVTGGQSSTVAGAANSIFLGPNTSNYLGGNTMNVKGDMKIRAQGDAGIFSSGQLSMTGESRIMASAPKVSITGSQLEVVGATGTIGGEGIIGYVKNLYAGETVDGKNGNFGSGVYSPLFVGTLQGVARAARDAQNVVGNVGYNPPAPSAVNEDATALPSSAVIDARQKSSANGVKKVRVDVGDFTRKAHDQSIATGLEGHSSEVVKAPLESGKQIPKPKQAPKTVVDDGRKTGVQ